jgi:hypothetical protein
LTAAALAAGVFAFRGMANAAMTCPATMPTCASLTNPIYLDGSSAVGPLIQGMGGPLAAQSTPVSLVYGTPGSCAGANAVALDTTPTGACATGACMGTGTATYYLTDSTPCQCQLANEHVDVGLSDVFLTSCGVTATTSLGDFGGPVQAMEFVVPETSTQTAIYAEEGYYTFGFGGMVPFNGTTFDVNPWDNTALMFIRNSNSGTQTLMGKAIAVPASKWMGIDAGGSKGVVTMVGGSTTMPDPTIGILSADNYDKNRGTLNALAFRAYQQWHAYYADSTPGALDKQNVRDGHYLPWSYEHMIAQVDGTGKPMTTGAQEFVAWLNGLQAGSQPAWESTEPTPPFSTLDVEIGAHTIPVCAMHVQRTTDDPGYTPYQDPAPCDCYFDFKATTATSCATCSTGSPCTTGTCRNGYCEVR